MIDHKHKPAPGQPAVYPCAMCGALASSTLGLHPTIHVCSFRCLMTAHQPTDHKHKENPMEPTPTLRDELAALTAAGQRDAVNRLEAFCLERLRAVAKDGAGDWFLGSATSDDADVRDDLARRLEARGLTVTAEGTIGYRVTWGR